MNLDGIWSVICSALSERQLARFARYMTVYTCVVQNELTKEIATDLLKGNLTPGDNATFCDDSAWMVKSRLPMDVINELLEEVADEHG